MLLTPKLGWVVNKPWGLYTNNLSHLSCFSLSRASVKTVRPFYSSLILSVGDIQHSNQSPTRALSKKPQQTNETLNRQFNFKMSKATHIIRFIAKEDNKVHLGQLVDTTRDIGLDSIEGKEIKAYLINGTIFQAQVTPHVYTVQSLLSPIAKDETNYIRCLGLNYRDHANVCPLLQYPLKFKSSLST